MQIETESNVKTAVPPENQESPRPFLWSVAAGWAAILTAGLVYARIKNVSAGIALPIIAAFLLELPLYLAPLFAGARAAAARMSRPAFGALLAVTAVLPYLAYSVPTGLFDSFNFFRLSGLAITVSFWYLVLPLAAWSDILFLLAPTAILVLKLFKQIYRSPLPHAQLDILGHLMLIHMAALAVLVLRGLKGVRPGLIPTRREAWIGLRSFLFFVPVGFALAWTLQLKVRSAPFPLWYAIPMFAGVYLVPAFSEEFALRGIVQQHAAHALGKWPGMLIASVLFGLTHLNFGTFPNWRLVILASAAGMFYGWAYEEAGSIRASMLTHALTAVVWLIWLR